MQLIALAAAVLPALAVAAPAGAAPPASIHNNCAFPIYVKGTNQAAGSQPGPVQTIPPKGTYSETQAGARFLYVGTTAALAHPLTFGYSYSFSTGDTYYDLDSQFGNPFAKYEQTLVTGTAGCAAVSCAAGDANCYSNSQHLHINACHANTPLTMTVCA